MTEKRFDVGNLKIQDNAPKGRLYLLDMQGGVNALCSLINGLNDKSNKLEKENEQLKQGMDRLFNYFAKGFEEERCTYIEEFIVLWESIQNGEIK